MFEVFEKYLRGWVEVSDEEMETIRAACIEKTLREWQSILHDGEIWKIKLFYHQRLF